MTALLIVVAAVIFISAVCSLCEAVLYAVPRTHIESLKEQGRASGRALGDLRRNVDQPITAILSVNTSANTAGAAAAGALAVAAFGDEWLAVFSIAFTVGILLFSELLPKTIGVIYARTLSEWIARPLLALVWILRPVIWLCSIVTRLVPKGTEPAVSEEDILLLARLGLRKGVIQEDEATAIQNLLALDDKTVVEVMTPRTVLFSLPADSSVRDAADEPKTLTHSRIPIYAGDQDNIVGLVVRRDLFASATQGDWDSPLTELARPVKFVTDRTSLRRVLSTILLAKQHLLVVVDEYGSVVGIVTLEDVVEEILGKEIVDEFDEVEDLRQLAKRRSRRLAPPVE